MAGDTEWRAWVHAALVADVSTYLVGHDDAIPRARTVATDIGNQGFVWTLAHYTNPAVPEAAAAALRRARERLFTPAQYDVLAMHRGTARPTLDKRNKRTLYSHGAKSKSALALLSDVDAPAALAAWDLLHPGATPLEIQRELLTGSVEDGANIFAENNAWVADRVKRLQKAARGLAVRKRSHRSQSLAPERSAAE